MKLGKTMHRMLSMCPNAWYIFIRSLQLSCLMHFCSFILLSHWNGNMTEHYNLYMTAVTLQETAQAVLITAVLLSAIVEDHSS